MRDDVLKVVKPRGHSGRTNSGDIGSPNRDIYDIYVRSLCGYTVALEPVAQQEKTPAADNLGWIPDPWNPHRRKKEVIPASCSVFITPEPGYTCDKPPTPG